ncbi:hypothetical protein G7Y79_00032g066950 [Physcia stellaris]|nr:hypothetical protein G7Y79_00032g066950 [Physcia stellaris]
MQNGSPVVADEEHTSLLAGEAVATVPAHVQELDRNFGLISLASLAITSGNTWIAAGGAINVAIYNGGPPGVLYEYIASSFFYWLIAASIAELASAIPSAGGASPHGRSVGFFAGWWNCLAWLMAVVSMTQITAAQAVSMYALMHPSFNTQRWHVSVSFVIIIGIYCLMNLYLNRALPMINTVGGFTVIAGVLISIVICAIMPHINSAPSDAFVFLLGMLNGAFSVGSPDVVTHLAEEIPKPSINIPKAILFQYVFGFSSGFLYLVTILYGINDTGSVLDSKYLFPLAEIYHQAAGSAAGAVGLLLLTFLPSFFACIGLSITASRTFWTLARDNAMPFSAFFAHISPTHHNPHRAILFCTLFTTLLGLIYALSPTAFSAFVGSFVVLSTLSYTAAILPHLLTHRRNVRPGWFWMPWPWGELVNAVACAYMLGFVGVFLAPFRVPVDARNMNYTVVITGGLTGAVAMMWVAKRKEYKGPQEVVLDPHLLARDPM